VQQLLDCWFWLLLKETQREKCLLNTFLYFCHIIINPKYIQVIKILNIPSSKSISNRLLILQALYPNLKIERLSTAEDTKVLQKALANASESIDIGHAGTTMRFLTAYYAVQENKSVILDGSRRMRQRPVKILVDVLQQLGADISYLENEGFPPLHIKGKKISGNTLKIPSNISSQYISALLLVAPKLPKGLSLELIGASVSKPYIKMTISLLKQLGIQVFQNQNQIKVYPKKQIENQILKVESDWSSASYFYSFLAVNRKEKLSLEGFSETSLQGDSLVKKYFEKLGIKTSFKDNGSMILSADKDFDMPKQLTFDLIDQPDLAQTLATTCLALGIECEIFGLQTLRIKETDRLLALKTEMEKLGASVQISKNALYLRALKALKKHVKIETYDDHRMAMSFAVLRSLVPIEIKDEEVVKKSFPNFWEIYPLKGTKIR